MERSSNISTVSQCYSGVVNFPADAALTEGVGSVGDPAGPVKVGLQGGEVVVCSQDGAATGMPCAFDGYVILTAPGTTLVFIRRLTAETGGGPWNFPSTNVRFIVLPH